MLTASVKWDFSGFARANQQLRRRQVAKLRKVGAYNRRTIMFRMRRRKQASVAPAPPSVHEGGLKRLQRFVVDESEMAVYNGPILYRKGVAKVLEHGGPTVIAVGKNKGRTVILKARDSAAQAQRINLPKIRQIIGE